MKKLFWLVLFFIGSLNAFEFGQKPLTLEEAFKVDILAGEKTIDFSLKLGQDIYVYKDKIKVSLVKPKKIDLTELIKFPDFIKHDGFSVYENQLNLSIPYDLIGKKINSNEIELELIYQGCSSKGLCYSPVKYNKKLLIPSKFVKSGNVNISETDSIVNTFKTGNYFLIWGSFFLLGLLLSLTPCVFPMIPILSSIIVSVSKVEKVTPLRGFTLALIYVLSSSLAYTIAGILAALFGSNLQVYFQNPFVLTSFAIIFIILALSMFGYFTISMPSFIQNKLTNKNNNRHGLIGVVIMGFLSALIAGPCVAPPLAAALVYIGQTADVFLGATALFIFSFAMGIPLLLIGFGMGRFMPKPGVWMQDISKIFGIIMLFLANYILSRIVDPIIIMFVYSVLFLSLGIFLRKFQHILIKLLTVIILIYGASLFVGALSGQDNPFKPFEKFIINNKQIDFKKTELNWKKVKNLSELKEIVKSSSKPVLLDFWASWCISCKEMEQITFKDKKVFEKLNKFTLLKIDISNNTNSDIKLQKYFNIYGPPAIILWSSNDENDFIKSIGYKNPKKFLNFLNDFLEKN